MTRALPRPPVRVVAAALLLAAGLFGPAGRAEAGCGDYLSIDGRPAADHAGDADRPPGEPCHGPNCSARECPPPAPLVPPITPNPLPKDRPAADAAVADPAPGFDFPAEPPAGRPVRRSSQPFHPPRSV